MDLQCLHKQWLSKGSGGFFGGLMKGFCFVAGTEIATPEGGLKVIETFMNGDTVITLGAVNDVIALHDMGEKKHIALKLHPLA